jgi:hypothetical protein
MNRTQRYSEGSEREGHRVSSSSLSSLFSSLLAITQLRIDIVSIKKQLDDPNIVGPTGARHLEWVLSTHTYPRLGRRPSANFSTVIDGSPSQRNQ